MNTPSSPNNIPPFNYKENGVVKGLSVDVVRAAFKEADLYIDRIDVLPWARGYRYALEKKNVFLFGILRTENREHLFRWMGTIAPATISFFRLKERGDIRIRTLEDAKKYKIGAIISDAKADFLQDHGFKTIQFVSDERQNLKKLLRGRFARKFHDNLRKNS